MRHIKVTPHNNGNQYTIHHKSGIVHNYYNTETPQVWGVPISLASDKRLRKALSKLTPSNVYLGRYFTEITYKIGTSSQGE